jgi:FAD/FMN-containing dehydrogenase
VTDASPASDALAALSAATRGRLLEPDDADYEEACTLWNARVDRSPTAVLRCRGVADVRAGVSTATAHDWALSVKGGGHHVSGHALCDGGLTLDLGPLDSVRVDPEARTARVGPGATWGAVDHETTAFDLAVPGGQDPNIGVAGLTLGGGVGWLSRQHGLTCDNLRAADVVTADGDLVHASETEHPDLFWALRGGGGSFGVVTSLAFDLHPVGEVFAGSLVYPLADAAAVARRYEAFMADAPRSVRLLFGVMDLPALDVYPESVQETRVAILIAFHAGPPDEGRRVLAPLRAAGDPVSDTLRPRSYTAWQHAGRSRGSMRTHLRSQYLAALPEAAVETIVQHAAEAPSSGGTVFLSPRGGAEIDPEPDATAYPHRDAAHHLLVEARWRDPAADAEHVAWVDGLQKAVEPYTTGEAALNFLPEDEPAARRRAVHGRNLERLQAVKRRWDPAHRLRTPGALDPET